MRVPLLLALVLLPCCGGDAVPSPKPAGNRNSQAWDLVSAYERAHREKNLGRALALVHLGSVETTTRDTLILHLNEDFQKELVSAKILPLDGQRPLEFVLGGVRVVPNLRVEKRLRLEFTAQGADGKPVASATEYFVGTLNGREMIATSCVVH